MKYFILRDGISLLSGQHIKSSEYNENGVGIPYLTGPADFSDGKIITSKYTTKPKVVCEPEDILVTVKGSGTGSMVIADRAYCISRQLMAVRAQKFDHYFLVFLLQFWADNLRSKCTGLIPGISRPDILDIKFPEFSDLEQAKLGLILCACDEAIEAQQKLIELKEKRLKGWMQKLLTGKVRFPQFADKPWQEVALGELVNPIKRKNSTGNKNVLTSSGKYGLVTQTDYFNKSVAGVNLANYFLLNKGEFAYNRSSSKGYPYGAIKRLDSCDAGVLSTLCICFSIKEISSVDSDFFKHFFEAGVLNRGLRAVCQEGARAHGLLNIIKSDFYGLKLKIPLLMSSF